MTDLTDHPFSPESISRETGEADCSERAWLRWCAAAEGLFGHDLDGNDVNRAGCGYSIDEAYTAFLAEITPHAYVTMVRSRERYQADRKAVQ